MIGLDKRANIVRALDRGERPKDVAKRHGVALSTVYDIAKKYGAGDINRQLDQEDIEQVVRLLREGFQHREIADYVCKSPSTISRIAVRCGLRRRRPNQQERAKP